MQPGTSTRQSSVVGRDRVPRSLPRRPSRPHETRSHTGANGTFIDTFTDGEGDRATGGLISPPFELVGDRMRLLVGGGRDPERLRVSLLVGDRRVFSETGTDWETLGRREWDIAPLRGQTARIEIVD